MALQCAPRPWSCSGPARMSLIPLVVFVLFAFVRHGEVVLGLIDLRIELADGVQSQRSAIFYMPVRSRLSERLSRDSFLTLPQMLVPVCSITWSYLW